MNNYIHILVKPDAFIRNIVDDILHWLTDADIEIYYYDIIKPSNRLLEIMYDERFQWEHDYYCHNKKLYDLGPSLSLLCKYDANRDYRKIKGASLPICACINSIRYAFDVKDRVLNLIHIADTVEQSQQEIAEIYGIGASHCGNIAINDRIDYNRLLYGGIEFNCNSVVEKVLERIEHKIRCKLQFAGYKNATNILLESQNWTDNSIFKDLRKLSYLCEVLRTEIHNKDTCRAIRFFDYFFSIIQNEMVYVTEIEKYIIISQCYYNKINL